MGIQGEIRVVPQVRLQAKLVILVVGTALGLIPKPLDLLHCLRNLFMQNAQTEGEEVQEAITM
jgi:hypothetical protein